MWTTMLSGSQTQSNLLRSQLWFFVYCLLHGLEFLPCSFLLDVGGDWWVNLCSSLPYAVSGWMDSDLLDPLLLSIHSLVLWVNAWYQDEDSAIALKSYPEFYKEVSPSSLVPVRRAPVALYILSHWATLGFNILYFISPGGLKTLSQICGVFACRQVRA